MNIELSKYYMCWIGSGGHDHITIGGVRKNDDYWFHNDIITLTLNTEDWTLSNSKNGEQMFNDVELKDVNDESVFYPVIDMPHEGAKYMHIVLRFCVCPMNNILYFPRYI